MFGLFCFLSIKNSVSQEQFFISGHVVDILSKQPIEGVNVNIVDSGNGTSTDSAGFFLIKTKLTNFELRISHISYQTSILVFDVDKLPGKINIQLIPKSFELSEVIIEADRQYAYSVVDFNFIDTNILILATKLKSYTYELSLINESFDTIAKLINLPGNRQGSIFKDFMGNCHLLLNDSAYQVFISDKQIHLVYPVHIDRFNELMGNCLYETSKHLVFKRPTQNKYSYSYYAVNKEDFGVKEFILHLDEKKMNALNDELNFIDQNPDAFPSIAGKALAVMYAKKIAFKPSENYLDKIGDTVYYFNHSEALLETFSENLEVQKEIDISYHLKRSWESSIIIDKKCNKAYTIFTSGMKYQIHEINLQQGTTEPKKTIPLLFPEKLKINNGYVYFLYKEKRNFLVRNELYQIKL